MVLYDSIDIVLYDSIDMVLYDSTDMVLYRCVDDKIGFLRTYCSLTNYNRGCLKKGHSEHLSIDSTIFPVQIFSTIVYNYRGLMQKCSICASVYNST